MTSFTTKFIYPIFILVLIFFLGCSSVLFILFLKIPLAFKLFKSTSDIVIVILGGILLFGYFALAFGNILLELRYGLKISDKQILAFDHWSFKWEVITDNITGYSKTTFGQYSTTPNTILIYLRDGRKINLPRFMYLNFKEIGPNLIEAGIPFFGEEKFEWRNIIQRRYKFK